MRLSNADYSEQVLADCNYSTNALNWDEYFSHLDTVGKWCKQFKRYGHRVRLTKEEIIANAGLEDLFQLCDEIMAKDIYK